MKKEYSRFKSSNLFEGIISLRALIAAMTDNDIKNDRKIIKVYYDCDRVNKEKKEYLWLNHRASELNFEIALTDKSIISEMAVGNTHGGIITETSARTFENVKNITKSDGYYVMLDGIEDPYNFGYALRSLYASGADGIILEKRNWMNASGVVCRASAGASELMNIYVCDDSTDAVKHLKNNDYKIVCADIENSVCIYEAELIRPLLCIVGGEKRGISRQVLSLSDCIVRIDYGRDFGASLSAASAATVIGFEIYRQSIKNNIIT